MTVILASQSPRRKELLAKIIRDFQVIPADIDETVPENTSPEDYVQKLAQAKANHILSQQPEAVVIGCDTIVVQDGEILGKPASEDEAFEMLMSYHDTSHVVLTGLSIVSKDKQTTCLTSARVFFYPLDKLQVQQYVATGEPMDKAGAYGIQGEAAKFIKSVQGDFYAIVGFPIGLVNQLLPEFLKDVNSR